MGSTTPVLQLVRKFLAMKLKKKAAVLAYISLKGRGASAAQRSAYAKLDDKT